MHATKDAGDGGPATRATLLFPDMAVQTPDGSIYISEDHGNIRRVAPDGTISTVARSLGTRPLLTTNARGDVVAATSNAAAALYDMAHGTTTFARVPYHFQAGYSNENIAALAPDGDIVVANGQAGNDSSVPVVGTILVKVDPRTGHTTIVAGTRRAGEGGLGYASIATDGRCGLYVQQGNSVFRLPQGSSQHIALSVATSPQAIASDVAGNLFVADEQGHVIRELDRAGRRSVAVTNDNYAATFHVGIAGTPLASRSMHGTAGQPLPLSSRLPSVQGTGGGSYPNGVSVDARGDIFVLYGQELVIKDGHTGKQTRYMPEVSFPPSAISAPNGDVYLSDTENNKVQRFDPRTGTLTVVAGTGIDGHSGDGGPATHAQLAAPEALVTDQAGNIYVAEFGAIDVRKIDAHTGIITTIAGIPDRNGFNGTHAARATELEQPTMLALDGHGHLYIVDQGQGRILVMGL